MDWERWLYAPLNLFIWVLEHLSSEFSFIFGLFANCHQISSFNLDFEKFFSNTSFYFLIGIQNSFEKCQLKKESKSK